MDMQMRLLCVLHNVAATELICYFIFIIIIIIIIINILIYHIWKANMLLYNYTEVCLYT